MSMHSGFFIEKIRVRVNAIQSNALGNIYTIESFEIAI